MGMEEHLLVCNVQRCHMDREAVRERPEHVQQYQSVGRPCDDR